LTAELVVQPVAGTVSDTKNTPYFVTSFKHIGALQSAHDYKKKRINNK